jgi:LuxR family maltose regulon positive regulatory protein
VEAAAAHLALARPLAQQGARPDWSSRFERCQLELWLAQGRTRAAVAWAEGLLQDALQPAQPEHEAAQLGVARALIAAGDAAAVEQALTRVARVLQAAEAEGRVGVAIEALALRALARWQRGDRTGALTALEHALRWAEPEGYVRLFADLGLPMVRLLQEARSRDVLPDYVATLLAACGSALAGATGAVALPERLSEREHAVLRLAAAGLTNREIADTLFISAETVKKHASSIYAKLGVRGRTAASARARELDLLDT